MLHFVLESAKEKKKEFDAFAKNLPANDSQKEYLTFWGIAFSNQLTTEEAEKTISEHASKARQDALAWKEFTTFMNLLEEFEDKDQREYYGLKEVPREIVATAIKNMKAKLGSYQEVADDPEAIVECILQAHPNLALP